MKLGERKNWKNLLCTVIIAGCVVIPTFAAEQIKAAQTDRVPAMKSFFSKFVNNGDKKETKVSIKSKANSDKKTNKNFLKNIFLKSKKEVKVTQPEKDISVIQGTVTMTIDDCVTYALKHSPNIKNYEATQKIQKSEVGIARSNYFPSLYAGTGYNINNTQYYRDRDYGVTNNYYGIDAGVNEMIWDFGKTTAKINMSKYNYEAAGYDLDNAVLDAIYQVKIAYTSVLAARANVDIYARSVKINQLNVDRTKAMYEVGLKSKIDLVNANANLTEAKIDLLQAQNDYQTALITLNNSMFYIHAPNYLIKDTETFNFQKNYSIKNEINVSYDRKNYDGANVDSEVKDGAILTSGIEKRDVLKTYHFKPFNYTLDQAIESAYENRPDLKSLKLVKKAAEESLKAVKRSWYPEVNASGGYTMANRSDYGSNAISIYAGVDIPSVNVMSLKYQIEQGKSYLDKADNNIDLLQKNIYFQVQNYYINMKQLEKKIPLMSQKVSETLENFELADGRYAVGLGNYIELQQAQLDYNNAQLAFVQSVFDYNQALFYLEQAMGLK